MAVVRECQGACFLGPMPHSTHTAPAASMAINANEGRGDAYFRCKVSKWRISRPPFEAGSAGEARVGSLSSETNGRLIKATSTEVRRRERALATAPWTHETAPPSLETSSSRFAHSGTSRPATAKVRAMMKVHKTRRLGPMLLAWIMRSRHQLNMNGKCYSWALPARESRESANSSPTPLPSAPRFRHICGPTERTLVENGLPPSDKEAQGEK
jgi:hypothetical protein